MQKSQRFDLSSSTVQQGLGPSLWQYAKSLISLLSCLGTVQDILFKVPEEVLLSPPHSRAVTNIRAGGRSCSFPSSFNTQILWSEILSFSPPRWIWLILSKFNGIKTAIVSTFQDTVPAACLIYWTLTIIIVQFCTNFITQFYKDPGDSFLHLAYVYYIWTISVIFKQAPWSGCTCFYSPGFIFQMAWKLKGLTFWRESDAIMHLCFRKTWELFSNTSLLMGMNITTFL